MGSGLASVTGRDNSVDCSAVVDHIQLAGFIFAKGGDTQTGLEQHFRSEEAFLREAIKSAEPEQFAAAIVPKEICPAEGRDAASPVDIASRDRTAWTPVRIFGYRLDQPLPPAASWW